MTYVLIVAMLIGVYQGYIGLVLTHKGLEEPVKPSKNLLRFLFNE